MIKYLILSDLHIGSDVSQRDKILQVVSSIDAENIILNGDIIDINHTKRLRKKDWQILSLLRKKSKYSHITYIKGNHDSEISETLSELLGFAHSSNLTFELNNKSFHVTHGDYFDTFISKFWLLTEIATGLYYWIQRIDTKKQLISRSLKRGSKSFISCCENIKKHAIAFANLHNFDHIICGHSHQWFYDESSKYTNSGCFTDVECSYITINEYGKITINFV